MAARNSYPLSSNFLNESPNRLLGTENRKGITARLPSENLLTGTAVIAVVLEASGQFAVVAANSIVALRIVLTAPKQHLLRVLPEVHWSLNGKKSSKTL
jgi:hypothetical protein